MKVTGTLQITSNLYPCPPLPVMHTPARKVKSDTKHKEWRVNPMARTKVQQQLDMAKMSNQKYPMARMNTQQQLGMGKMTQKLPVARASNTPSSLWVSPSHKSNRFGKGSVSAQGDVSVEQHIDNTQRLQFLTSFKQQNAQRITLGKHKFDGVRKTQYLSINNKFSNLTMALNSAYKKSQEQAEKRLKLEKILQEKSCEVMSC